jgi:hypothetical protein
MGSIVSMGTNLDLKDLLTSWNIPQAGSSRDSS